MPVPNWVAALFPLIDAIRDFVWNAVGQWGASAAA
jgi:hypothetical protein